MDRYTDSLDEIVEMAPGYRRVSCTLMLIGGPFQQVFGAEQYVPPERVSLDLAQQSVTREVWRTLRDYLHARAPGGRVTAEDDQSTSAKNIVVTDGDAQWIYKMTAKAQRNAEPGVYPYTFMQSASYYTDNLRNWSHFPSSPQPLADGTTYRCEEFPLNDAQGREGSDEPNDARERGVVEMAPVGTSLNAQHLWADYNSSDPMSDLIAARDETGWFAHSHNERTESLLEVPTTHCFDCGHMVPIADTWTKKNDPNYALCEACFRRAEAAGRAKEGAQP